MRIDSRIKLPSTQNGEVNQTQNANTAAPKENAQGLVGQPDTLETAGETTPFNSDPSQLGSGLEQSFQNAQAVYEREHRRGATSEENAPEFGQYPAFQGAGETAEISPKS